MKIVDLGLPELSDEQIEELCEIVEKTAREHILSKVSAKQTEELNISVEAEGSRPVNLTVEVHVSLTPLMRSLDVQKLANEAIEKAFSSAEKYLRELKCHSKK